MKKIASLPLLPILFQGLTNISAQEKPNILLLTFEDTSPQFIGVYGNQAAHTLVMDSLNNNGGVRFNYAYSNSTVSSPSRSCLITGIDPNILGTGNHRYDRTVPSTVHGYPYYLRQAGYYTSNNVKTDYNISNSNFVSQAWNESSANAHWRNRPTPSTPFFSVFNINYSHQSYSSRDNYGTYYTEIYQNLNKKRETFPNQVLVPPFYRDDDEMRFQLTRLQNCINYTDQIMGNYLKQLRTDGLDQNTIVFIFSDHGSGIPRAKTCAIGMGYRVPFIVWFPDKWKHLNPFNGNTVTDKQICFEDVAPTILGLAGVMPPTDNKGKNFLGPNPSYQEYIHGFRNRIDGTPGIERSVIKGRYVYTRVFSPYTPTVRHTGYTYESDLPILIRKQTHLGQLNDIQKEPFLARVKEYLYDLQTDKWETNNLATNPDYASLVEELRNEMVRYVKSIQDIGFIPEYEMTKRTSSTTPYAHRSSYNWDSIIDAAMLCGEGTEVLPQQIALLQSENAIVRYWASLGIYNQGENAINYETQIREAYNKETLDGAKIEQAAFLYKYCNDLAAANVLSNYAKQSDELLANDAVTKILYFGGEKTKYFKDLMDEIQPYWAVNGSNYSVSPNVNVTKKIIRDMDQTPFTSKIVSGDSYHLRNSFTGGYAGVKDNSKAVNAEIIQTLSNTNTSSVWRVEKNANDYYSFINQNSSLAFTINAANAGNNVKPYQVNFTGGDGQLWILEPYQYGFLLKNKSTQKTLQVSSQSTNEGAAITQYDWNGKLHFNWVLEPLQSSTYVKQPFITGNLAGISAVYPNPVKMNNELNIEYKLHEAGKVAIDILNLEGKCIHSEFLGTQIPGPYHYRLNTANINRAGMYMLSFRFQNKSGILHSDKLLIVN
jgi:arylsulfatase A-like enzyme